MARKPAGSAMARPFASFKAQRVYERIAMQIEHAIFERRLRVGDKLPAERGLAAQLGVSRVAVREAVRLLELRGLLQVRKGPTGGHFVRHTDADVLTHAIGEALLGSLALGDLGRHFPDTDPRYKGASSLVLLRAVIDLVRSRGGRLVNVDATVLAQAPRLSPHLPEMATRLAGVLGVPLEHVSVKAKSPEGLGLVGRREGIAAMAVVSVETQ